MRKTAIALLALVLTASVASATVFYQETFSYPDGPLGATPVGTVNPTTGWLTHSSTLGGSATDIQVVSGKAIGNMANAPDDSRPFGAGFSILTGATDKTYSCMKFKVTNNTPGVELPLGAIYFAHFKDAIPTGTTFTAKLFVQGITAQPTKFNLGISNGPANTPVYWPTSLSTDVEYVIATRFDAATGLANLWVNPASEASATVNGTDTGATGRVLAAYGLRQSTGSWSYTIDDLSVGTSFDEVCGGYPTPATPSTWGRLKSIYR